MFEMTKPQKEIQKAARDFAKGEFDKELAYELEKKGEYPEKLWKKAAELGFIGIHFPETYSGGEMGLLENCLIIEELCRNDPSLGGALAQASYAAECILKYGSAAQKEKYLPEIAEGKIRSSGAFIEGVRGCEVENIETSARKEGDKWTINGSKKYVINAGQSGFYIVLCNTGDENTPIEKRQSMFLVDAGLTGIKVSPYGKKLGNNLVTTGEVSFENVAVTVENLLGKEGNGYRQYHDFLDEDRIITASIALGNALASFDRMLEYVKGREQFGKKLAEFQVSQHKIADMATKLELSRLVLHKAAWERDRKKTSSSLCSMAKMTAARTAMEIGGQTIQLFGGYGYMTEYEVERFYRDAKAIEIRDGARDTQRDLIAKAAIGKIK